MRDGECRLGVGGGRACKKLRMPVAQSGALLRNRLRDTQLDQHDDSGRCLNRRSGMHHNAESALICIAAVQVHMGHLYNGNQRHQNQAHHQPCRRGIPVSAKMRLVSRQFSNLSL